jgi:hypothetical protein
MTLQELLPEITKVQAKYAYAELLGTLPGKYTLKTGLLWDSQDATDGYHQALRDVQAVLAKFCGINKEEI